MSDQKTKNLIIWTNSLYFGWLLSFPFYGPVLFAAAPQANFKGLPLVMIFIGTHALTYLLAGLFLKKSELWYRLMTVSLLVTLIVNSMMLLPLNWIWPLGMAIMGAGSSIYILGWSCIFSLSGQTGDRIQIMAAVMIIGNLILLSYNFLLTALPARLVLAVTGIPLVTALIILLKLSPAFKQNILRPFVRLSLPKPLLIIFSLFIFSIYLNGGFMYRIMLPTLSFDTPLDAYYPFIIYILVLVVIRQYSKAINKLLLVYLGVSFLGLAFISFALLSQHTSGYLMTVGLMESSFALLDIFVWTTLGSLAFIFGAPFQIFGMAIAANTASILCGDIIAIQLLNAGETQYLVTALLSATSIFLAVTVIPWLNRSIDKNLALIGEKEGNREELSKDSPYDILIQYLQPGKSLTERENQVVILTLQGMTNKDIARQLFISEHTVKTHLKNICNKFGVTRKKELLHLATRK
jgi:DNA-binding CsgD family transcriptional regulator